MKICFFITRYVDFLTQQPLIEYFGNHNSLIILAYSNEGIVNFIENKKYQYTEEIDFIKATIFNYSALVTSSAMSHDAHTAGFNLTLFFKKAGLITFELQHGISQLGINSLEPSQKVGFDKTLSCGFHPFYASDYLITWRHSRNPLGVGPEFVPLGCPRMDAAYKLKKSDFRPTITDSITKGKDYVLIPSNSVHRTHMGRHNKGYIKLLRSLVDKHKNIQWILKLHPSESKSDIYNELMALNTKSNVTVLTFDDKRLEKVELYDLLLQAKAAIACNSSVALDAIYLGCPTFIFNLTENPFYVGYREELNSTEDFLEKVESFFLTGKINCYSKDEFLDNNLTRENEGHHTEKIAGFIIEKIKHNNKKITDEQFCQYIDLLQRDRYHKELMAKKQRKSTKNKLKHFFSKFKRYDPSAMGGYKNQGHGT